MAALAAVGIDLPSAPVVRFAIAVIRACDSERRHRGYDPHDDDAREAFQRGALSRVRTPHGLPALYLLLTIPALLDLQTAGNVVEQADDVLKDLAAAIVDGAMAPDHAGTIL